MIEFTYTMTDPIGLHARPAGMLAKKAAEFKSTVTVVKGEKSAETRRIMALMGLGVKSGDTITLRVEGDDEQTASAAIKNFLEENKF